MTDTNLARRAVACKHWRWMPGMEADSGSRCVRGRRDDGRVLWLIPEPTHRASTSRWVLPDLVLPDLNDPATIGCLLALVREAHGDPKACAEASRYCGLWAVHFKNDSVSDDHVVGNTEAEALVAALEAAP